MKSTGTTVRTGLRTKLKQWLKKIVVRSPKAASPKKPKHAKLPKEFSHKLTPEEINHLPVEGYKGHIHLVASHKGVVDAVTALEKDHILGFDTETKPSFVRGVVHPPALLQLVGSGDAYLFQLQVTGIPNELAGLLSNANILKAGVAVTRDVKDLKTLTAFEPRGFVDLGKTAEQLGLLHHGLRGLAATLLGCRITKAAQMTNWAQPKLPDFALRYAATDAWIGRRIYLELCKYTTPVPLNLVGPQPESNRQRRRRERERRPQRRQTQTESRVSHPKNPSPSGAKFHCNPTAPLSNDDWPDEQR